MVVPQVFGINAPALGLALLTLFVRWRVARVPHYISTPGMAVGAGVLVMSSIPNVHPVTWATGLLGVALLAFAVEWQLSRPPTASAPPPPPPPAARPSAPRPPPAAPTASH